MKRILSIAAIAASGCLALSLLAGAGGGGDSVLLYYLTGWPSYGYNSQHSNLSPSAAQPLFQKHWWTPVDLNPQYSGPNLLIHYGSPLITARNNVLITVKVGATGTFRVDSRKGSNGALNWSQATDYVLPSASWTPSCGPTLTPRNALVIPAIGGTVLVRNSADLPNGPLTRQAFFGINNYNAAAATYNSMIKINTPITSDTHGNLFFGFLSSGATPVGLVSGLARLDVNGNGTWIAATTAAADATISKVVMNCAPAISPDGAVVYVGVKNSSGNGYLVGLDSTTLAPLYKVRLKDPKSNNNAGLSDNGTASPTVASDGEVYYGVLESPGGSNHSRGWMLHFDSTLTTTLTPGAFGWDDTASVFPSATVPQYSGTSSYLVLTKYNNYAGAGDGLNKVAVLDPHASMIDPISGIPIMNEIITKIGPTPDPPNQGPNSPNAVREWCINASAIDIVSKCAIVNNEDGMCYRWDFATNTLSQVVPLTPGIGEAYTPTLIGPDGQSYAINNAILFALGH